MWKLYSRAGRRSATGSPGVARGHSRGIRAWGRVSLRSIVELEVTINNELFKSEIPVVRLKGRTVLQLGHSPVFMLFIIIYTEYLIVYICMTRAEQPFILVIYLYIYIIIYIYVFCICC